MYIVEVALFNKILFGSLVRLMQIHRTHYRHHLVLSRSNRHFRHRGLSVRSSINTYLLFAEDVVYELTKSFATLLQLRRYRSETLLALLLESPKTITP